MRIFKFKTAKELKSVCSNIRSKSNKKWLFDELDIISVNGIKSPTGFEVNKYNVRYYSSEIQGYKNIRAPFEIIVNK